jgi:hypothetical protein
MAKAPNPPPPEGIERPKPPPPPPTLRGYSMPIDENQDYVKPAPRIQKLRQYMEKLGEQEITEGVARDPIEWLCNELDGLEQRLDYFHTIKADKKEPNYRTRRPKPHHFRGTRD